MSSEIVITGIGCCTSLGNDCVNVLEEIQIYPNSQVTLNSVQMPHDLGCGMNESMAAVQGPDPTSISGLRRPFPDRPTLMALLATDQAIAQAAIDSDRNEVGLIINTCFGPSQLVEQYLRKLLENGPAQASAITFSRAVSNAVVGEIARRHNLRGPSTAILGSSALSYAADLLTSGSARAVVCAGVDEVRDLHLWAYRQVGFLDEGLLLGEGAGALVMEQGEAAQKRGGTILTRITGYASVFCPDSVHKITAVNVDSIVASMRAALKRANLKSSEVDCVVSLASDHREMLEAERVAVQLVLGRDPTIWLWPKRVLGECFGGSEVIGAVMATAALHYHNGVMRAAHVCIVNVCQVGGSVTSLVMESIR